ncbi:MAG: prolipoprotein diacylglyceryl transferase [Ruminiclostridium sp.]|nr:prolipoprotein diacylglyceryl transferase [Ruminiclostridium sp.]
MNTVAFPGLGLTFHLDRVALSLGSFQIYWYGVIIALGAVLAVFFCMRTGPRLGIQGNDFLDVLLFALPGGIIGARLYYIIFNPSLYVKAGGGIDLAACVNIHKGGLAIYGGILAGTLIVFLVSRHKKIPFPAMVDLCTFGLLIGQIAGRWGNFVNVEAYGGETDLPWRMGIETAQGYWEVHPTFLYESLWNLLGFFLLLLVLGKGLRKFDGMLFLLYLAWYGFGRGFIEGLRTDSLYFFDTGLRVSQLLGFASCVLALLLLVWKLKSRPDPGALYVNRHRPIKEEKPNQETR